jgi:hypothetical protein
MEVKMGRFCGIDPSLIDDFLESTREETQKIVNKKEVTEGNTLTEKMNNNRKEISKEEETDGIRPKR